MPSRGLVVPVYVAKGGGAATVEGDDQLRKVIELALASGDDDNPFQELGMREDIVFAVDSEGNHGLARQRVRRILAKFSDRVALDPKSPIVVQSVKGQPGQVRCRFRIINLETDSPEDFDVRL